MIEIFGIAEWIFWLILLVVFLIIEATTVNLVSIWFAIGCLFALIASLFKVSFLVQCVVFVLISSIAVFVFLYFKKKIKLNPKGVESTNADRIIGQTGIVIETIDLIAATGQIKVLGQIWSALSIDKSVIHKGVNVVVKDIAGVKAVVEKEIVK